MFTKELFGARLREVRERRQETQKTAAEALGISIPYLSDMERGRRTTTTERLAHICDYYEVSADYLLGRKDEYT